FDRSILGSDAPVREIIQIFFRKLRSL
ncbi:hypothetical protein SNEBB_009434, partial [Seison nebaliae]